MLDNKKTVAVIPFPPCLVAWILKRPSLLSHFCTKWKSKEDGVNSLWFLDLYTTTKLFKGNQVSKLPSEVPELNNKLAAIKKFKLKKKASRADTIPQSVKVLAIMTNGPISVPGTRTVEGQPWT